MAQNNIPGTSKGKVQLAVKMSAGITKVGASVPVTMVTKAQLDGSATAFKTAEANFGSARQAKMAAYIEYIPAAAGVKDFLTAARAIFVSSFGNRWSADWATAGFVNNSTAVPKTDEERISLLDPVVEFLVANPSFEVPKSGVTAENGADIYNHAVDTEGAVMDTFQALRDSDTARKAAESTLVNYMRLLMKNLDGALKKDDPRWLAFGLNIPGSKVTPAKPTGLTAQMDVNSGGIILTCDAQPLAERWRFRGRVAGSQLPFQLLARSTQPTARTKSIQAGTTMEFTAQAVNGGSQSVPSDSVFFTTPLEVEKSVSFSSTKSALLGPVKASVMSSQTNGNGTNGQRAA